MATSLPPEFVQRLNAASVAKRFYPFDRDVIDWSVPIDDTYLYLPEQLSVFWESGVWSELSPEQQSFATRWEITQMFRNAGLGEHALNQGILAMLWATNQYDPEWRFLLHEVAEECQHMAMFNAWVVANADLRTVGLAAHPLGWRAGRLAQRLARRRPELFWLAVLLFEGVGDDVFRQLAKNEGGRIHPILQQIGRAHVVEEARHIAFALRWLEVYVPELSRSRRFVLHRLADRAFALLERRPRLFPLFYDAQIAPLLTREQFRRGCSSPSATAPLRAHVRDVAASLERVGAVDSGTVERLDAAAPSPA